MHTLRSILAILILALGLTTTVVLASEGTPKSADEVAAEDTEKSALEQKYANEAREKIANETTRVGQSQSALFWGIASFVTIAAIMGVFTLLKTQSQAKVIAKLEIDVAKLK